MKLADNILISGPPGIGKSTLIRMVCEALGDRKLAGFSTREIRHDGKRQGFELVGLDGQTELLSDVDVKSPFRIGRYGVDIGGFERPTDHGWTPHWIQGAEPSGTTANGR